MKCINWGCFALIRHNWPWNLAQLVLPFPVFTLHRVPLPLPLSICSRSRSIRQKDTKHPQRWLTPLNWIDCVATCVCAAFNGTRTPFFFFICKEQDQSYFSSWYILTMKLNTVKRQTSKIETRRLTEKLASWWKKCNDCSLMTSLSWRQLRKITPRHWHTSQTNRRRGWAFAARHVVARCGRIKKNF